MNQRQMQTRRRDLPSASCRIHTHDTRRDRAAHATDDARGRMPRTLSTCVLVCAPPSSSSSSSRLWWFVDLRAASDAASDIVSLCAPRRHHCCFSACCRCRYRCFATRLVCSRPLRFSSLLASLRFGCAQSRLYIGNLPAEMEKPQVEDTFMKFGRITNTWIAKNVRKTMRQTHARCAYPFPGSTG